MKTMTELKWERIEDDAKAVREFILEKHGTLEGMCFFASRYLSRMLKLSGIPSKIIEGTLVLIPEKTEDCISHKAYHVWLEIFGAVVDLTADQYSDDLNHFPEIVITTYEENTNYKPEVALDFSGEYVKEGTSNG